MQMESKTRRELADMIGSRAGTGGRAISVFVSATLGWDACLLTSPPQAHKLAQLVRQIAGDLRAKYYLSD
jgi:hypothetical protein